MRFSKSIVSLAIALVMVLSMAICPITTTAVNVDTATVSDGASDIVSYASSLVGKTKAQLGYTFDWCAAFVADCAKSVGQASAIPYNTYVSGLYSNILGAGGYTVSSPQAGDLVFYTCTSCGYMCHVGIMTGSQYSVQGNIYLNGVSQVYNMKYSYYIDSCGAATTTACYTVTFVRPNYTGGKWYANMSAVNIGDDVYAKIIKNDTGICLGYAQGNVELVDSANVSESSIVWRFDRLSDGSYVIYNCESSTALDVSNAGTTEGTNIGTYTYWGGDAQKWFIYGSANGQYILKPKLCDLVLDVNGNYNTYGTNVQLWSYNNSTAQQMRLEFMPVAATPVLTVDAGDYKTLTSFSFDSSDEPLYYKLVINCVDNGTVTLYDTIDMIQNDTFMYELPQGSYQAYAEAFNSYSSAKSNTVSFEITAEPVVSEDGWIYSDKLYSDITSTEYEIQYLHTYSQVASTSPGDGWTKGDYVRTDYVNSGDPYWSNIELATSNTRVLLNYIYYHYCSGSTGNEVNYEATSTFTHYDWLPKDSVYEYSVNNDYADSRYKFYHLKFNSGGDAYCSSGTSCDGAYGSHGNRSYYWYKSSQYQDKVAVDYYSYTKPAQWTTSLDSSATDVTYRYRLKTDGLLGDVDYDGNITIIDATCIQRHLASLIELTDGQKLYADTTKDGDISILDVTSIQRFIAQLITEF